MITKTEPTFQARIYMSGPIEVAKQAVRRFTLEHGECVTIDPTLFIYTGGEEAGFVIGFVNYPRFPRTPAQIIERARKLMLEVLDATYQHSALLVAGDVSEWVSKREEEK